MHERRADTQLGHYGQRGHSAIIIMYYGSVMMVVVLFYHHFAWILDGRV